MAKSWFITGVSSGIGRSLAELALVRGDTVVGTVRQHRQVAPFEEIAPGRAHGLLLDVDRLEDIPWVAASAIDLTGGIDIVVNNAGRSLYGAVEETGTDEAAGLFNTNVLAPMAVTQAFLPHFRSRGGGLFVNLSSGCGLFGTPGVGVYSASKFALEGLSEAVAAETGPFGVQVMVVEPGAVATRFISHATQDVKKRLPEYEALSGNGKAALDAYYDSLADDPADVARAILDAVDSDPVPFRLPLSESVRAGMEAKGREFVRVIQAESNAPVD